MANFRKDTYGPGSMKGVELVILAYDNRVAKDGEGKVTTHYLDARIHPEDRRAAGQATLALVSKKDEKSPSGYNNSARYSAGQMASIKEAAGANVTDLTMQDGTVVGKIYGVKADLISGNEGVVANTKTLVPSEFSVQPDAAGKTIRQREFDVTNATKLAKQQAQEARNEAAQAEANTPSVEQPVLVGAGAPVAAADEPALG
ncbi:hypothetical protein OVA26_16305 [Microbacterium sp. SL62]|uniref:hypothetical protein n=1 Tax=Microbacterium sp. SL62 TaxID=2995139 RepID=UPI0022764B3B|nr:hypothetical protein [Microbacterium sp. SL62]MCY1718499.1 hypothetical protein [Microbacterium sp. SL62]